MPRRLTQKEFEREVYHTNADIKIIDRYKGYNYPIKVKCLKCGAIFIKKAKLLLHITGNGCPYCSGHNTTSLSNAEFKEQVYRINPNVKLLSKYKNKRTRVKVKCLKCGYIFWIQPGNLTRGYGCPNCYKEKFSNKWRLTQAQFVQAANLKQKHLVLIGHYAGDRSSVRIKCLKCGYIWNALPGNLKRGGGCPRCTGEVIKSQAMFLAEAKSINPGIEVLGQYTGCQGLVKIKCRNCGYIWERRGEDITNLNLNCPKCGSNIESYGEQYTEKYLRNHDFQYQWQYKITNCRHICVLPFDFAVFDKDKKLKALIEYQGSQHFKAVDYFGGKSHFKNRCRNDAIKRNYCKQHNIKLICINHYPFMSNTMSFIQKLVNFTLDKNL